MHNIMKNMKKNKVSIVLQIIIAQYTFLYFKNVIYFFIVNFIQILKTKINTNAFFSFISYKRKLHSHGAMLFFMGAKIKMKLLRTQLTRRYIHVTLISNV